MSTTLKDLLSARAVALGEELASRNAFRTLDAAATTAVQARGIGEARAAAASQSVIAADAAIHQLLKDRGMHSLVDPKDQTVIIYAASDQAPGWFMTHPIPGTGA